MNEPVITVSSTDVGIKRESLYVLVGLLSDKLNKYRKLDYTSVDDPLVNSKHHGNIKLVLETWFCHKVEHLFLHISIVILHILYMFSKFHSYSEANFIHKIAVSKETIFCPGIVTPSHIQQGKVEEGGNN